MLLRGCGLCPYNVPSRGLESSGLASRVFDGSETRGSVKAVPAKYAALRSTSKRLVPLKVMLPEWRKKQAVERAKANGKELSELVREVLYKWLDQPAPPAARADGTSKV
jgi:hypothetical protein